MKAAYYKVMRDDSPEVIGIKDATSQGELVRGKYVDKVKYDAYIKHLLSYDQDWLRNQCKFPSQDFDFEYVKLKKRAKLSDFIYFGPSFYHRYLVNSKVRSILSEYNLPQYKFYPSNIYDGDGDFQSADFKFFFCPSFCYDFVNFEKCQFSYTNDRIGKQYKDIKSKEEYFQTPETLKKEKVVLKDIDENLDLFHVLIIPELIISVRLHDALVKAGVTGIVFSELNDLNFSIH